MDSNALAALAGILLSLGFSYIPGLNGWYGAQTEQIKRLVIRFLCASAVADDYILALHQYGRHLSGV